MRHAFVLVHSPLVGPATWTAVAGLMRDRGHEAVVPDLTGALDGPPYVERQVSIVAAAAPAHPLILVGHSGAGALLPAIGAACTQVSGYVFVDAGLPTPGRSWTADAPRPLVAKLDDMQTGGWLPPWSAWWGPHGLDNFLPDRELRQRFSEDCPRLPMAMFEEIRPLVEGWPDAPCAYLRLSEGYSAEAERARALGWPTAHLESHHLAMLTDPERVAAALLQLASRLYG